MDKLEAANEQRLMSIKCTSRALRWSTQREPANQRQYWHYGG